MHGLLHSIYITIMGPNLVGDGWLRETWPFFTSWPSYNQMLPNMLIKHRHQGLEFMVNSTPNKVVILWYFGKALPPSFGWRSPRWTPWAARPLWRSGPGGDPFDWLVSWWGARWEPRGLLLDWHKLNLISLPFDEQILTWHFHRVVFIGYPVFHCFPALKPCWSLLQPQVTHRSNWLPLLGAKVFLFWQPTRWALLVISRGPITPLL